MPLATGARLGPYEIVAAIGAGGMGEVYRARDTKLDRDVAIKIVPELFAADPDRLIRFEREAKTLASLNHSNIAHIHGVEGTDIVRALVMEFVDGEDLSQRLTHGAIPVPEALAIARQIADALEAAHERGVIHRDLKPANIKVREDGTVKVLDFGLSKAMDPAMPVSDPALSPTFTSPATQLGVILGTAAYMAPEQAKGKTVDKRADIWAFGVVLYEMLTGRSPFPGETITDVLAHIISRDPDWSLLPPDTPQAVRDLLKRCLERDPKRRLRDIGDARLELDSSGDVQPPTPAPRRPSWLLPAVGVGLLAIAAGVTAGFVVWRGRSSPPEPRRQFGLSRLSIVMDPWQAIALSADGRVLAYRGFGPDGIDRLYVRSLDALHPTSVEGSEGGRLPFLSADGSEIGFFSSGHLRRVSLAGGGAQSILALRGIPFGGTFMDDGSVVFVESRIGLQRVPRSGNSEVLIPAEQADLLTPWALPGNRGILVSTRRSSTGAGIAVLSLADRKLHPLADDGWSPAWSPSGGVLFSQGDSIVRLPFDIETLTATGSPEPVLRGIRSRISVQTRLFGVANDGTLAYMPASATGPDFWKLVSVDRQGRETHLSDIGVQFDLPRLSPDGSRIAFRKPAPNCDIWSYDLSRGTSTRLTLEGDNHGIAWSADGSRIGFSRVGTEAPRLLTVSADGGPVQPLAGPPAQWLKDRRDVYLTAWSERTGAMLLRSVADTFIVTGAGDPQLLGMPTFDDSQALFSPDGTLIAYVSDESGRSEVYVQPIASRGRRLQVSTDGGGEPVWARSGKELFFRQGLRLLAVDVATSPSLSLGRPRVLFTGNYTAGSPNGANYDVSRDGRRFFMVKGPSALSHDEIVVVLNAFTKK